MDHSTQSLVLPVNLLRAPENDYSPGEASWVSFCRAIEVSCGETVLFDMVAGDADRCPADLPTVPMQVSLRDIVAMALAAGMECTYVSFEEQSVFMQGMVGSITSGRHPILGPLVHYTPRWPTNPAGSEKRIRQGVLGQHWLQRVWGTSSVAGRTYNYRLRRAVQRLDERWLRYTERMAKGDVAGPPGSRSSQPRTGQGSSPRKNTSTGHRGHIFNYSSLTRPQDGLWTAESRSRRRSLSSVYPSQPETMEIDVRFERLPMRERPRRSRQSSHVRTRLTISEFTFRSESGTPICNVLVLNPSDSKDGMFERVGTGELSGNVYDRFLKDDNKDIHIC